MQLGKRVSQEMQVLLEVNKAVGRHWVQIANDVQLIQLIIYWRHHWQLVVLTYGIMNVFGGHDFRQMVSTIKSQTLLFLVTFVTSVPVN